jgi:hypothetical protein
MRHPVLCKSPKYIGTPSLLYHIHGIVNTERSIVGHKKKESTGQGLPLVFLPAKEGAL